MATQSEPDLRPSRYTLHEIACWFAGEIPSVVDARSQVVGADATTKARQLFRLLKDDVLEGTLPSLGFSNVWIGYSRIKLSDAIAWATSRRISIPSEPPRMAEEVKPISASDEGLMSARESGVTRSAIIGKFPVKQNPDDNIRFWDRKLSDPPEWLRGARLSKGGKRVSGLWDPVQVAHALLDWKAKYIGIKALDKVMRESFPDRWIDWQEETSEIVR